MIRMLILAGFLLMQSGLSASPISDAVALMKANAFRPLATVDALNQFRFGSLLEPIFAYSNGGAWDPVTKQMLMVGAPHGNSMHFIRCPESDLTWREDPMPAGDWSGAHTYDHLTVDTNGIFYHLYWQNGVAYRYDTRAAAWISPLPATASGFGALDYFPELNGLVRVVNGGVYLYRFNTGSWQTVRTGLSMGGLHNMAQYSSSGKFLIFGGGDGSQALYKMDTSLNITTLNPMPFQFGVNNSIWTADPVTGTVIIAQPDSLYAYDAANDRWKGAIKNPIYNFSAAYAGFIPITSYGVVALLSTWSSPVLLYKYANPAAVEKDAAAVSNKTVDLNISPNPFHSRTSIICNLPGKGNAEIKIMNSQGRLVRTLAKEMRSGSNSRLEIEWDGKDGSGSAAAKGIYIVAVRSGGIVKSRALFLE